MLIPAAGEPMGTVGGGAVEHQVLAEARRLLAEGGDAKTLTADLSQESSCGGKMEIFLEPYRSDKRMVLIGAGHVGAAVAQVLIGLGWDVTILDPRAERLQYPEFSSCRKIHADFLEAGESIAFSDDLFILIMTPDHKFDARVAAACLEKPWKWLGIIGSKRKAAQIKAQLTAEGLAAERIARLRIPVGIEIGSDTPEEIAISISAELIQETSAKFASSPGSAVPAS
jgi:xanthine dehydrogenase accessory factor